MPDHRPEPQLRWHTETVERSPIFVVPGDSSGSGTLKPMGKTWGMRVSGDVDKIGPHRYRCPVHGVFELDVSVAEPPAEVSCNLDSWTPAGTDLEYPTEESCRAAIRAACGRSDADMQLETQRCGDTATWAGSSCAIGIEPGMVTG